MIKGHFYKIALTALTLFSCCGCTGSRNRQLPELVIGCDDYRPYCYIDDSGDFAGMNVEVASEACRRMGYEPVFRQIEWDSRGTLLENGDIDCMWGFSEADSQDESYSWISYMTSRQVVAVLSDSPVRRLSELEGRSVAVMVMTNAERVFLDRSEEGVPAVENVYSLTTMSDVVTALRNDYVDACAGYAAVLREQLENIGVDYRFLDEDLSSVEIGVVFSSSNDPELPERLSGVLADMRSDGTLRDIVGRYVDADKALGGS